MRLLLVHRYYWPDVPTYARALRFLGEHFAREGHDVTVYCGPPSYNDVYQGPPRPARETVDGVRIHRVRLPPDIKARPVVRALSMLVFAIRVVVHAVRKHPRYDLVMVTTIPPVVMGLAARVIRRLTGAAYVYHAVDLYPEVAELAGVVRSRWLPDVARRIDSSTCRRAEAVVVLSDDMRDTLAGRGLDIDNVRVLNNFDIEDHAAEGGPSPAPKQPNRFRILFAGNIGHFQGLEHLVDAAERLRPTHPELELVFMGSGARVEPLKRQAAALNGSAVRFLEHQPLEVALRVMEESDLAVISLRRGIYKVAYPSKTMMYLNAGCRLLAIVEAESELARFVSDEGLGVTCPPGDVDALSEALERELKVGGATADDRVRNRAVGERHFGRPALLARWSDLLGDIEKASP